MANRGPAYGLSAECEQKSEAKFSAEGASKCLSWIERVTGKSVGLAGGVRRQDDFHAVLKDGTLLCELINALRPGSVKKINRTQMPFMQRENIEQYLEGALRYGQEGQDLFQVNDLYEAKNLYLVINNLHLLGGLAQKLGFRGPAIGARQAVGDERHFVENTLKAGQSVISLQYGSNKGASQKGMTPYGASRDIRMEDTKVKGIGRGADQSTIPLRSGSNQGASQKGMTAYGAGRDITMAHAQGLGIGIDQSIIPLRSGSNQGASQKGMTPYGASRDIRIEDVKGISIGRGADQSTIPLQSGSNQGASQKGMTAYGAGRDITMAHAQGLGIGADQSTISLQYGSNKGASQKGMTAYGSGRDIRMEDAKGKSIGIGADQSTIPLRSGSNQGASQKGMTAYGTGRQIL